MRRAVGMVIVALMGSCGLGPPLTLAWMSGPRPSGTPQLIEGEGAPADRGELRVATWNLHYGAGGDTTIGRSGTDEQTRATLDAISTAIRSWDLDVLVLQEVDRPSHRSHGTDQLELLRSSTGLTHAAFLAINDARWIPFPNVGPSAQMGQLHTGIAVLSRHPIRSAERVALPNRDLGWPARWFDHDRAALHVQLEIGDRGVDVVAVHLEPDDATARQAQLDALGRYCAEHPVAVLAGDFNTGAQSLYPLSACGLASALPARLATPAWATFPASAARIDHLLHGAGLVVHEALVPALDPLPSDHRPVVASFARP